jgi:hypothetical protein
MRRYAARKSVAVVFNGITFRRYPNAKQWAHRVYYTPHAAHRRRGIGALHQEVWKAAHGPIPAGYEIHHKNDPLDNSLENLECLTRAEHDKRHLAERSRRAKQPKNLAVLAASRPRAAAWHASQKGRAWHSETSRRTWPKRKAGTTVCQHCHQKFQTPFPTRAKFCGSLCRQRFYAATNAACVRRAKAKRRKKARL